MLHSAVVCFVVAIVATLFGFSGLAAGAVGIGKVLFVLFAAFAVAAFVFGLLRERGPVAVASPPTSPRSTTT